MTRTNASRAIIAAIAIFVLTAAIARTISFYWPRFHVDLYPGVRVHHYVYGIFLLTIAGYLALLFKGPRATAWIACMYGLGVGLTFDEFGFWINLNGGRGVRWHTGGLALIGILFFASVAVPAIYSKLRNSTGAALGLNADNLDRGID
jgi:hypothetical protein